MSSAFAQSCGQLHVADAVANIIDNAVAAANTGVDVIVGSDDGGTQVVVADNGPGIDAAAAPHVGEPFFTTKERGTGLGLFLARVVCERLGGELVIDAGTSGTTVLLDIPRRDTVVDGEGEVGNVVG